LKLIVGFGNPGDKHVNNRQNIGFKVIEILANNANIDVRIKKKKSVIGRGKIKGQDIVLLKPQTFVNLIGESVLYIASFLRINVNDIICIYEDSTLELGDLRVDYMMATSTHEGVSSMAKGLKSDRFAKVRIGVGTPEKGEKMKKYLLKDFTDDENLVLIDVLNKAESVIMALLDHPIEEVQNKYNPEGAPKIKKRVVKVRKVNHAQHLSKDSK
jgi:peptidyl-tRNA hydrolase, PTH1 family